MRVLILATVAFAAFCARRSWGADSPIVPVVHVLATDPCAAEEGRETATFTVYRDGPTNAPLTIRYWATGSASNGVDYAVLSGEVTIPAAASSAPITVRPVDDPLLEGGETVAIFLAQPFVWPPPYTVCWPSFAVGHIEDNEIAPTNRPPLVRITNPPDGSVFLGEVDLRLTARASDSDGRVLSVEFFDGTNSLGIVYRRPIVIKPIPVIGDAFLELADEREPNLFPDLNADPVLDPLILPLDMFVLAWNDVPPGSHVLTAVATDNLGASTRSAPVRIEVIAVPPQPVVSIKAVDPVATEPDDTAARLDTATFVVRRTGSTDFPLTVYYRIGGTAENGVDYRELTRNVTIPRGARGAEIVVAPLPDRLVEGPESVAIIVVAPPCIAIYPPPPECYLVGRDDTARAVINDNDPRNRPPVVEIVRPLDGSVFLAPADIEIVATARDYDGRVVTVEFFEGTNSLGRVTNNHNWAVLTTNRPVFSVKWPSVGPGHYILTAVATDDDGAQGRARPVEIKVVERTVGPVVTIASVDSDAAEVPPSGTPNPAVFSVKRTGATDRDLLVHYSIGGTAANGVDYRMLSGQINIPIGASAARIVVDPIDDRLAEGTESVGITIEPPICIAIFPPPYDCYIVGAEDRARAAIRDNDLVNTNLPPKVALIRPEDGSVFAAPATIAMVAAATDADGWIRTVEFFEGANRLGIVSNSFNAVPIDNGGVIGVDPVISPEELFRFVWENAPAGDYVLRARATDNRGAASWSDPVRIQVIQETRLPVVVIEATDPYASELDWRIDPLDPVPVAGDDVIIIDPPIRLPDIAIFTVTRDRGTNFPLTVYYTVGGTASNGVDYGLLSGRVTIPAGQFRAPILIGPLDDRLVEGTETVVIHLSPTPCPVIFSPVPACYHVGEPDRAVAFIRDDDFANEPPKVEIVRPVNDQVFRAGSDIDIVALTRDPDGYVNEVSFFANDRFIGRDIQIFIVAPPPGQEQRFSIIWSNVPPGDYLLTAKATDSGGAVGGSEPIKIKVIDACLETEVNIEAYDPIATERDPRVLSPLPPDEGRFRVTRSCGTDAALTVYYEISGTASNGVDYRRLGGEVVIPAGARSADIVVDPIDDNLAEGPETVIVKLTSIVCVAVAIDPIAPGCYVVGPKGHDVVTIRDNDQAHPRVAIVQPETGDQFRSGADVPIVVQALDPDGWVSLIEFFANDRKIGEESIVFIQAPPPGQLQRFSMVWSNPPPGKYALTARATDDQGLTSVSRPVLIEVHDAPTPPVVTIFAVDPLAREGTPLNPALFRIRRSGPTNQSLTVHFTIRGTASNGVDYARIPSSVTIPAGRRAVRLPITPIDDRLNERYETVVVRLLNTALYNVGRPGAAGALILDNDCPRPDTCALPDRDFHLRRGADGIKCYRVETSVDLVKWDLLGSNALDDEAIHFVDPEAGDFPHRFYRILPCDDVEVEMLAED